MKDINQKYLEECFNYNPETGELVWNERPRSHFESERGMKVTNSRFTGKPASAIGISGRDGCGKKYIRVRVFNRSYQAHRIIWMHQTGSFPDHEIDHIDGNGLNNRWDNLRPVNRAENSRNQRLRATNTSGIVGVSQHKDGKWHAVITHNYKSIHLGRFLTRREAAAARAGAEIALGFHPNHGEERPL